MTPAVDARDVFKVHRTEQGDAAALQGLTLRVEQGEIVAVLGPSGSGKSSLLRVLAALEPPSAGIVRIFGRALGGLSPRATSALRARHLGLVDQHYDRALPPDLPCLDTVGLQLALLGVPRAPREARARELLARVGLEDAAGARPGELSGGEQQRVALCAALAHRPGLLLADEPAGELDARSVEAVYALISELARESGAAVVLVSHDPGAARAADRTVRIHDGRLSEETRPGGDGGLVVGRGGWIRLPEDAREAAGIGARVRLVTRGDELVIEATGTPAPVDEEPPPDAPPPVRPEPVPVAEVRGVTKRYGEGRRARAVLGGLSASFPRGRLTVVSGRSGSGKSTLLRLLAGLERPSAGEVVVLDRDLAGLDRAGLAAFRRDHVAVVGQDPGLVPFLSALENVTLGLAIREAAIEDADALARTWLVRLGLGDRIDQLVARLSAGERQRVALARALAPGPDLLLVDEPTSRLDERNSAEVARLLAEAARLHGATVVCATHEPVLVEHADGEVALDAPLARAG